MMNKTTVRPSRITFQLDDEAVAALDRARQTERLSRPSLARAMVMRSLRADGHIPTPNRHVEAGQ